MESEQYGTFVVIENIKNNRLNLNKYECIPSKWIKEIDSTDKKHVVVGYPSEDKLKCLLLAVQCHSLDKTWRLFHTEVVYDTDSFEQALQFITENSKDLKIKDAEKQINKQIETPPPETKQTLKRKQEFEQEHVAQSKRSKDAINPAKPDCHTVYANYKEAVESIVTLLDKTAQLIQQAIAARKNMNISRKIQKTVETKAQPKLKPVRDSDTKNNTENSNEVDITNDTKVDSKWTLKYPEQGPGLEELLPNTGVYVSTQGLLNCISLHGDAGPSKLALGLLEEIFTPQALKECLFDGTKPKKQRCNLRYPDKPALNLKARETLVDYVMKYSSAKRWEHAKKVIVSTLKGKLFQTTHEMRMVNQIEPSYCDY